MDNNELQNKNLPNPKHNNNNILTESRTKWNFAKKSTKRTKETHKMIQIVARSYVLSERRTSTSKYASWIVNLVKFIGAANHSRTNGKNTINH